MDTKTKFECFLTFLTYRLSKPSLFHLNYLITYDKHSPFFIESHLMQLFSCTFLKIDVRKVFEWKKLRKAINQFAQLLFCGLNCLLFMSHEKLSLEIFLSLCDRNQWTNIVNWQTFAKHFCISHFDISKISKHFIWIQQWLIQLSKIVRQTQCFDILF